MEIESQGLIQRNPEDLKWLKWVPLASLCVSFASFVFALTVLYPWHLELSEQFTGLQKSCLTKENTSFVK